MKGPHLLNDYQQTCTKQTLEASKTTNMTYNSEIQKMKAKTG